MEVYSANAHEILPRLWLGNRAASEDNDWLASKGIRTVFNCTKTLPFSPLAIHTYRVPVDDNLQAEEINNMRAWAPEAVLKLIREYKSGEAILVHCHAGMQRSAALVAMMLVAYKRMQPDEAMEFIREKRPIAFFPRANFERAIRGFTDDFAAATASYRGASRMD